MPLLCIQFVNKIQNKLGEFGRVLSGAYSTIRQLPLLYCRGSLTIFKMAFNN